MYSIVKEINEETKLATYNNKYYILKNISLDDMDTIKKLLNVNNPHIVKFIDIINIDGLFYAVEEYINGITLTDYLSQKGILSEQEIKNIASSICLGLHDVHALGIVHRDINPNNIMIDSQGTVKIIDFGISRVNKHNQGVDTHILGTQGYAAPEQYGFSQTNQKADIYAIGVLINYMATLKFPNDAIAEGHLGTVVKRCVEIDEEKRYPNVDILLNDLIYNIPKKRSIIPGFRSDKTSHKVIALIYYAAFLFLFVGFTFTDSPDGYSRGFWAAFIILILGVPVPIFTNFLGWCDKLEFTKFYSPQKKKVVIITVGTAYIFLAFLGLIIASM